MHDKFVFFTITSSRLALVKSVLNRLDQDRLEFWRFALERFAPDRSDPINLTRLKLENSRFA